MSTIYKVRAGDIDTCSICDQSYSEGTRLVHLSGPEGMTFGICCLDCYEEEQEDFWG